VAHSPRNFRRQKEIAADNAAEVEIIGGNFLPPPNFCVTDDTSLPSQFD
jgi:hypothetical protein